MKNRLAIVRGNDFSLTVPVRSIVFAPTDFGVVARSAWPINLDECEILCVNAVCECDNRIAVPFVVVSSEEGSDNNSDLKIKISADFPCGWYGLEVMFTIAGQRFRSYERKVFRIVENNGKSYVSGDRYEGEQSYQVDIMWTLYALDSTPAMVLNTDNMTLEMHGTVVSGEMYIDENGKLCMRSFDMGGC